MLSINPIYQIIIHRRPGFSEVKTKYENQLILTGGLRIESLGIPFKLPQPSKI